MAEENEEKTLEEIVEEQILEIQNLRQDLNILAMDFKKTKAETDKFVTSMNKDMIQAQNDITRAIVEISNAQKHNVASDYVGVLLSDDLKEREQKLVDEVKQIFSMQSKQNISEPKKKKFLRFF